MSHEGKHHEIYMSYLHEELIGEEGSNEVEAITDNPENEKPDGDSGIRHLFDTILVDLRETEETPGDNAHDTEGDRYLIPGASDAFSKAIEGPV